MADVTVTVDFPGGMTQISNPPSNTPIMASDPSTGKPGVVLLQDLQNNSATNVIGTITSASQAPTGTETQGQAYDFSDDILTAAQSADVPLTGGFNVTIPQGTEGGSIRKQSDGSWVLSPIKVNASGIMDAMGFTIIQNDEFVSIVVDANGRILYGVRVDGTFYIPHGVPDDVAAAITTINAAISGINTDIETINATIAAINIITSFFSDYNDPEGRLEIKKDASGNILSYRGIDGTLHEDAGIETPTIQVDTKLSLSSDAMTQLEADLKAAGISFTGKNDQSDADLVELPITNKIAYLNFDIPTSQLPNTPDETIKVPCNAEYWDQSGSYWKKPVQLATQGDSSAANYRKNFSIDIMDGSTIKFGDYCDTDSYHLKGYYTDAFRGREIVGLRLMKDIVDSRPYRERYAFYDEYVAPSIYEGGTGTLQFDFNTVATYIPNGWPVAIYGNGVFYGVYAIVLKKERDNMDIKKSNLDEVWIDGTPSTTGVFIFNSTDYYWHGIPLKSPTGIKDGNGNDYDEDDQASVDSGLSTTDANSIHVKSVLDKLAGIVTVIDSLSATADKKEKFLTVFDLNSQIDYYIHGNILFNSDYRKNWQWYTKNGGNKWAVAVYDLDELFGIQYIGNVNSVGLENQILMEDSWSPMKYLRTVFTTELNTRYAELRNKGIISTDYIIGKLREYLNEITYSMLKADLKLWPETPSYRDPKMNTDYWECLGISTSYNLWDSSTAYSVGDYCRLALTTANYIFRAKQANTNVNPVTGSYVNYPADLGFYESVDRVAQVIDMRISMMDSLLNYTAS